MSDWSIAGVFCVNLVSPPGTDGVKHILTDKLFVLPFVLHDPGAGSSFFPVLKGNIT